LFNSNLLGMLCIFFRDILNMLAKVDIVAMFGILLIFFTVFFLVVSIASLMPNFIRTLLSEHVSVGTEYLYDLTFLVLVTFVIISSANDASYVIKSERGILSTYTYVEFSNEYFIRNVLGPNAFLLYWISHSFKLWDIKYLNKYVIFGLWCMYLSMSIYEGLTYVYIPFPPYNILFVLGRVYIIGLGGWIMFEGTGDVEKWVKKGVFVTGWIYYVKLFVWAVRVR
jgi:hypothetical protein